MDTIKEGNHVLFLWSDGAVSIEDNVNSLKNIKNVTVNVENIERIALGKSQIYLIFFFIFKNNENLAFHIRIHIAAYSKSTFDVVLLRDHQIVQLNTDVQTLLLNLLKPQGKLICTINTAQGSELKTKLLFAGYVNCVQQDNGKFLYL